MTDTANSNTHGTDQWHKVTCHWTDSVSLIESGISISGIIEPWQETSDWLITLILLYPALLKLSKLFLVIWQVLCLHSGLSALNGLDHLAWCNRYRVVSSLCQSLSESLCQSLCQSICDSDLLPDMQQTGGYELCQLEAGEEAPFCPHGKQSYHLPTH